MDDMVSKCELPINVVIAKWPKVPLGHTRNMGRSGDRGLYVLCHGRSTLPAERKNLTHPVNQTEHGKPVSAPKTVPVQAPFTGKQTAR